MEDNKVTILPTEIVDIDALTPWKQNPKVVKKEDFERLKQQILDLGLYRNLVVNSGEFWGTKGTIAGGNTRWRALKELGATKVSVVWVSPKTDGEMLKYAASDNDEVGRYDDQMLAELSLSLENPVDMDIFRFSMGKPSTLTDVIDKFGPGEGDDEQPRLDETEEKKVTCPECGHEFDPNNPDPEA